MMKKHVIIVILLAPLYIVATRGIQLIWKQLSQPNPHSDILDLALNKNRNSLVLGRVLNKSLGNKPKHIILNLAKPESDHCARLGSVRICAPEQDLHYYIYPNSLEIVYRDQEQNQDFRDEDYKAIFEHPRFSVFIHKDSEKASTLSISSNAMQSKVYIYPASKIKKG